MTAETLTALQESIRHWHRLATGTRRDCEGLGPSECALCRLFFYRPVRCHGCLVAEASGNSLCLDTPYMAVVAAVRDGQGYNTPAFLSAAREELNFLLGLLPAEVRPAMEAELGALDAAGLQ